MIREILPDVVHHTKQKILHDLPRLFSDFKCYWNAQSQRRIYDASDVPDIEDLIAILGSILPSQTNAFERFPELMKCVLMCWNLRNSNTPQFIVDWQTLVLEEKYEDSMVQRASLHTGRKWYGDIVDTDVVGDERFWIRTKILDGKDIQAFPSLSQSPGRRLFEYLARYLDAPLAIANSLANLALKTDIHSVKISIIDDFDFAIQSDPSVSHGTSFHIHAEVKLAMFYLVNSDLNPLFSIIGLSSNACYACDLFLKYDLRFVP